MSTYRRAGVHTYVPNILLEDWVISERSVAIQGQALLARRRKLSWRTKAKLYYLPFHGRGGGRASAIPIPDTSRSLSFCRLVLM